MKHYLILGSIAAICNGGLFPIFGLLIAKFMGVLTFKPAFYNMIKNRPNAFVEDSILWTWLLILLSGLSFLAN